MTVTVNAVTIIYDCSSTETVSLGRTESSPVSSESSLYIGGMTSPVFVVRDNQISCDFIMLI